MITAVFNGFEDFLVMADITPWVVKIPFDGNSCIKIEKIDLITLC